MAYIYTCGCYDGLHQGHLELLKFCKELAGDSGNVVVGLNTDVWMIQNKRSPKHSYRERRRCLLETGYVWNVVQINTEEDIRAHLSTAALALGNVHLVKGEDYEPEEINGADIDGVTLVRMPLVKDSLGNKLSSSE